MNPEMTKDYNPNQYSFQQSKADGMMAGRMLMKDEIIRLIQAINPNPTKAIQKTLEQIQQIKVDLYANDTSR